MTPTLIGRIQTRILMLFTVGFFWTVIAVPFIPRPGATIDDVYAATVLALIVVAVLGIGWELLYHFIQQYRWEKDWPILFGLVVGFHESILAFFVVDAIVVIGPPPITFFLHFYSTWTVIWLVANGPLRAVLLRWRFDGGRVL